MSHKFSYRNASSGEKRRALQRAGWHKGVTGMVSPKGDTIISKKKLKELSLKRVKEIGSDNRCYPKKK